MLSQRGGCQVGADEGGGAGGVGADAWALQAVGAGSCGGQSATSHREAASLWWKSSMMAVPSAQRQLLECLVSGPCLEAECVGHTANHEREAVACSIAIIRVGVRVGGQCITAVACETEAG